MWYGSRHLWEGHGVGHHTGSPSEDSTVPLPARGLHRTELSWGTVPCLRPGWESVRTSQRRTGRGHFCRVGCSKGVRHHHLHLAEAPGQAGEWGRWRVGNRDSFGCRASHTPGCILSYTPGHPIHLDVDFSVGLESEAEGKIREAGGYRSRPDCLGLSRCSLTSWAHGCRGVDPSSVFTCGLTIVQSCLQSVTHQITCLCCSPLQSESTWHLLPCPAPCFE